MHEAGPCKGKSSFVQSVLYARSISAFPLTRNLVSSPLNQKRSTVRHSDKRTQTLNIKSSFEILLFPAPINRLTLSNVFTVNVRDKRKIRRNDLFDIRRRVSLSTEEYNICIFKDNFLLVRNPPREGHAHRERDKAESWKIEIRVDPAREPFLARNGMLSRFIRRHLTNILLTN